MLNEMLQRHPGYLWRWLVIALIDVGLNAPENLSRLGLILGIIEYNDDELFYIYRIMAQVSFTQERCLCLDLIVRHII